MPQPLLNRVMSGVTDGPSAGEPHELILTVEGGTRQEFTLSKASVSLGRATTSDIVVRDWAVSRSHARIDRTDRGVELVDLGSTNGTFVNGQRQSRYLLSSRDEVTLGGSVF
jgi:pSer/pThr/pTyr-binding forkhead associated (FHA) protein